MQIPEVNFKTGHQSEWFLTVAILQMRILQITGQQCALSTIIVDIDIFASLLARALVQEYCRRH